MEPSATEALSRALANRYTLERELGRGGMATVYLAQDLKHDRPVALKVLHPELAATLGPERFLREIRLAARLQHPHILTVLDSGEAAGRLWFTMPYVEGESLRLRLARAGELPVRDALRVLRDVAAALVYAHDYGVVHRDIKPDNVLLSGGEALVADFGVAKALSASATDGDSGLTSLGVALGTPAYMAPEQAAADPHVDHRADIYAFGCLAYEVLTGQPPFIGRSVASLMAAHATESPEAIDRRRPALPPALAILVMHCLEKRPADRPQSASEVLQLVEGLSTPSGGTEPTRVIPPRGVGRQWSSRARAVLGGITATVLVGIVATVWGRRAPEPVSLNANLLAVAPFDALGPGLDLWREGFVDLLSRNLDGAGPLRTVSPTVIVRRWSGGRADPVSAEALGRSTGAGLTVYGTLVATGTDSVRLSASVFDVREGRALGEVQLRGDVRRMDALSDSLTVALLRELSRSRPIVAVKTAGLRATSLPALKAFLEGERYYRAGAWDSAIAAYGRALAVDSTFVPALRHLGLSLWWKDERSETYREYILRAAALNHGLSRRDSILITVDSNYVALDMNADSLTPDARRGLTKRLFGTLADATRLYPDDPEAWYALGESRNHLGGLIGITSPQILEAFDRAIALDSFFEPAWVHAMDLAPIVQGVEGWDRYLTAYLQRVKVPADADSTLRMINGLLHPVISGSTGSASLLKAASSTSLDLALWRTYRMVDSSEAAVQLARELATRRPADRLDALKAQQFLAYNLAYRGHVEQAARLIPRLRDLYYVSHLLSELALIGAIPAEEADDFLRESLDHGPLWVDGTPPVGGAFGSVYFAPLWWASRGDTASLQKFGGRIDSATRTPVPPGRLETLQFMSRAVPAYLALARKDTATAIRLFGGLSREGFGPLERLTEGVLLARRGRETEALELLDRTFSVWWVSPLSVMSRLETARAAERLGQRERAVADYQYVLDAWRHADPVLQPHVTEARTALTRLSTERP